MVWGDCLDWDGYTKARKSGGLLLRYGMGMWIELMDARNSDAQKIGNSRIGE